MFKNLLFEEDLDNEVSVELDDYDIKVSLYEFNFPKLNP